LNVYADLADGRDEGERIPKMAASKVVRFEEGSQGEEQKHVGGKRKRYEPP